ncbi:cyclase family protein [Streptomyces sp. ACA25]|uniref:cyclase family protein n=1 Tax=Streptomyces sp. ACA25 TaxID=3022596 RepID=UPI0023083255|nr:cyclase family protein [Streptomyces sp. ACA25]MDB1089844.1 cyclase family protein [Streptomyces sp. ACA25]
MTSPAGAAAPWTDISVPVDDGLTVFPGTPGFRRERVSDVSQGDDATLSALHLSTHTGTHVDAPAHFLADGDGVDSMDLNRLTGPAKVLDIPGVRRVGAAQLGRFTLVAGDRVLLRTDNSAHDWYRREFDPGYAHLTADGARHLAALGVAAVGIDYLSIGGEGIDNPETHRTLLSAGIAVLEGLDLSRTPGGAYELCCLPLRITGGDGAPARALLRQGASR